MQISEKNLAVSETHMIEENLVLREALQQLPELYRKILIWRIVEGRPLKEVADELSKPVGTVKSLQFRGVQKLMEILEEGGYFNG